MKPELLMPVGNVESLRAAVEGGADAVYLGLSRFNARGRARNFGPAQFGAAVRFAQEHNVRVYVTLNTLVKNNELSDLFDTLYLIKQSKCPVIIQDLGVYSLIKKYFPEIEIHASTQMGICNSLGPRFLSELGFSRVILARELTYPELEKIKKKSPLELEIFVHGALCYSFSGYCLFSSYLGGMSANRGQCRQPCRRLYNSLEKKHEFFNLNDLSLIELIPRLSRLGISSLKVEGRMKSAEYVLRVAQAYRMVLDDPSTAEKAKALLRYDMGRKKTSYFMGGDVSRSLTTLPYTGLPIGKIQSLSHGTITFTSSEKLSLKDRLRILPQSGVDTAQFKVTEIYCDGESQEFVSAGSCVTVPVNGSGYKEGDPIFLTGTGSVRFSNKLPEVRPHFKTRCPEPIKRDALKKLHKKSKKQSQELYLRINSLKWLPKIFFEKLDRLVLALPKEEWQQLDLKRPFLQKNLKKIILQLPLFIVENELPFYREMIKKAYQAGVRNFMLSHIVQKSLFTEYRGLCLYSNEQVYALNMAAEQFLHEQGIERYVLPFENDFPNLLSATRAGVVPLYFFPPLFYSRMPVSISSDSFQDKTGEYQHIQQDGMTFVVPTKPVSLLQHRKKLEAKGYTRFLIDLSFEKPSQNRFNRLLKKFMVSEPEQPSTIFNFKRGIQ